MVVVVSLFSDIGWGALVLKKLQPSLMLDLNQLSRFLDQRNLVLNNSNDNLTLVVFMVL